MVGYIICFISPLKHLYNDAVVIPVAIIKGLRFPFTVTSSTGIYELLPGFIAGMIIAFVVAAMTPTLEKEQAVFDKAQANNK